MAHLTSMPIYHPFIILQLNAIYRNMTYWQQCHK